MRRIIGVPVAARMISKEAKQFWTLQTQVELCTSTRIGINSRPHMLHESLVYVCVYVGFHFSKIHSRSFVNIKKTIHSTKSIGRSRMFHHRHEHKQTNKRVKQTHLEKQKLLIQRKAAHHLYSAPAPLLLLPPSPTSELRGGR